MPLLPCRKRLLRPPPRPARLEGTTSREARRGPPNRRRLTPAAQKPPARQEALPRQLRQPSQPVAYCAAPARDDALRRPAPLHRARRRRYSCPSHTQAPKKHALREPLPARPAMRGPRLPRASARHRDRPYCHRVAMPLEARAQLQKPNARPLFSCQTKPSETPAPSGQLAPNDATRREGRAACILMIPSRSGRTSRRRASSGTLTCSLKAPAHEKRRNPTLRHALPDTRSSPARRCQTRACA